MSRGSPKRISRRTINYEDPKLLKQAKVARERGHSQEWIAEHIFQVTGSTISIKKGIYSKLKNILDIEPPQQPKTENPIHGNAKNDYNDPKLLEYIQFLVSDQAKTQSWIAIEILDIVPSSLTQLKKQFPNLNAALTRGFKRQEQVLTDKLFKIAMTDEIETTDQKGNTRSIPNPQQLQAIKYMLDKRHKWSYAVDMRFRPNELPSEISFSNAEPEDE